MSAAHSRDLTQQQMLEFEYRVMDFQERSLRANPVHRASPADYVFPRDQAMRGGCGGDEDLSGPGSISIFRRSESQQEHAAGYEGRRAGRISRGAHGVILSRKYSEMKLANLSGAGEAIQQLG